MSSRRLDAIWRGIGFAVAISVFPLVYFLVSASELVRLLTELEGVILVGFAAIHLASSVCDIVRYYLNDDTAGTVTCLILMVFGGAIGASVAQKLAPSYPNFHPFVFWGMAMVGTFIGIVLSVPVSDWKHRLHHERLSAKPTDPGTRQQRVHA